MTHQIFAAHYHDAKPLLHPNHVFDWQILEIHSPVPIEHLSRHDESPILVGCIRVAFLEELKIEAYRKCSANPAFQERVGVIENRGAGDDEAGEYIQIDVPYDHANPGEIFYHAVYQPHALLPGGFSAEVLEGDLREEITLDFSRAGKIFYKKEVYGTDNPIRPIIVSTSEYYLQRLG